ncbi:MAG: glycosyltransferase [Planctomycetota bacterium]|jgi:glycosyltransferase involved in cell wall biosynthesis
MVRGTATICVVNYKTLEFTRLCLRSIRKFTKYPFEVIVVDNHSQDESLEYLRSLKWIRLIERDTRDDPGGSGGYAHAKGLDVGLIRYFGNSENVACVGSGKIELAPKWRILLKKATDLRTFKRKLLKERDPLGKHRYYNRTICCVYRTDILRRESLSFLTDREKGLGSGKKLYFDLVDRGYRTVELPPAIMGQYVTHLAHATQVVNAEEFALRRRTRVKCNRLVDKVMSSRTIKSVLEDSALDK